MKFFYLVLIIICASAAAEDTNILFLHTKYVETIPQQIEDKSYKDQNGNLVIVPPTIVMKFEVVDSLYPDGEFEKRYITLPLEVGTDYPFSLSKGVIFILKRESSKQGVNYNVLDWSFVGEIFCINKELIPKREDGYYFHSPLKGDKNRMCRFL